MPRFWRALLAIALVGLGVRVAYVGFAKVGELMIGDQISYSLGAHCLGNGEGFVEPFDTRALARGELVGCANAAADHPPLTMIILAPVSALTGESPMAHRFTMALLGAGVVVAIGLLARELAGDRAGLAAGAIAAVYPNLWVNDGLVMSETIAALMVTVTLLLAYRMLRQPTTGAAAALGATCGLAALARAELALLVPLVAVPAALLAASAAERGGRDVAVWTRGRATGVILLTAIAVVAPWVTFNLARFDEPTFLSTNDGATLVGANCDAVYRGVSTGLWQLDCLRPFPPGDQSQKSQRYRDLALDYIADHDRRFVVVAAARIGRTWSLFRPGDMFLYNEGEGRERWVTGLGLVAYYPLLGLAVGGLIVLWRRRQTLWPLMMPIVVVTVVSAATYGQTRFRVSAEPALVVAAAVAVDALFRRRPHGDDPAAPGSDVRKSATVCLSDRSTSSA